MPKLTLEIDIDQAAAMARMLDLAVRIHMCQFGEIEYYARAQEIKHQTGRPMNSDEWKELEEACNRMKAVFGFGSGASFGIGSQHISKDAHRGYEIKKVVDKALAMHGDPNPQGLRGVNYDGLVVRYTNDPAPVAVVK